MSARPTPASRAGRGARFVLSGSIFVVGAVVTALLLPSGALRTSDDAEA